MQARVSISQFDVFGGVLSICHPFPGTQKTQPTNDYPKIKYGNIANKPKRERERERKRERVRQSE